MTLICSMILIAGTFGLHAQARRHALRLARVRIRR
jgi:hypothetical protein